MRQLQAGAVKAGPARHGERMMTRGASGAAYYPAGGQAASSGRLPLGRYLPRARELGGAVPPSGLALLSIVSVQIGAAIAKNLFHLLGPGGAVFLRTGVAAVVLLAIWRPRVRGHAAADFRAMILFGLVIAAMNTAFYSAIARLPLGIAVTLEFVGPLGVAIFGSRRKLDVVWGLLAGSGVLLLAPIGGAALDPLGVVFALVAAAGWAGYILLNVRVGRAFPGANGLALSMAVAAFAATPYGLIGGGTNLAQPSTLLVGAGVALLSTVIPFSLEHAALKRLPARAFGVLMSLEPAFAALVGFVLLGESLGARGIAALACVSLATVGSARFGTMGE